MAIALWSVSGAMTLEILEYHADNRSYKNGTTSDKRLLTTWEPCRRNATRARIQNHYYAEGVAYITAAARWRAVESWWKDLERQFSILAGSSRGCVLYRASGCV